MMKKRVIFFPKTLLGTNKTTVELLGFTELMLNVKYYFVFPSYVKSVNSSCQVKPIGHFTRSDCQTCNKLKVTNVLCITDINGTLNANLLPGQSDYFLLVMYDPSRLYDYGTSLEHKGDSQKLICFEMLSKWLSSTSSVQAQSYSKTIVVFQKFSNYLLIVINALINSFEVNFVKLTILRLALFKHILAVMKNYAWLLENLIQNKHNFSKAKSVNYLISCIFDAFFGITVLYLLNTMFTSSNELFSFISNISHVSVFNYLSMFIKLYFIN